MTPPSLLTVGHSTWPIADFIELLGHHAVAHIADVRTLPRSRRHPHFNRDSLAASLARAGIAYTHLPDLGGLRSPRSDSLNTGWRIPALMGYADHMQTPEFERGLGALVAIGRASRTAFMCAESSPDRCHRSLIADALLIRGVGVDHILGPSESRPHRVTSWARVRGTRVIDPPSAPELPLGDA